MNSVTLQPMDENQATIPEMKAMDVPFYLIHGSLICVKRLQSDRQNKED